MFFSLKLSTFLAYYICVYVESMTVIPQLGNVTILNEKYVEKAVFNVRRYSRTSPYVMNVYGITKHTWGNNMTVDVYFSEFLHNEYRRSFIEMHHKFCDLINKEPYIGGMLKNAGIICPMPAGEQKLMNMTVPTANFPNVFPFEKGRVDLLVSIAATKEPVLNLFIVAIFKQKVGKVGRK